MNNEIYYTVTVKKHVSGFREQQSFERLYDSEHPKMKLEKPPEQYGYKTVVKSFTDSTTLLEQRVENVELDRVIRAINKNI